MKGRLEKSSKQAAMSDSFLQLFEKQRLEIENKVLRMPEAHQILARYGVPPDGPGQTYLHALPTVLALVCIMARSPRTAGAFRDRVERAGPTRIRHHETEKAFLSFGIAYLYKFAAKKSGLPEMANLLVRMATLAVLSPRELEKVDYVVRTFSARGRDGRRDRLAPACMLLWWLSGGESSARAYEADYFLELYADFIRQALDLALDNQIHMQFPW